MISVRKSSGNLAQLVFKIPICGILFGKSRMPEKVRNVHVEYYDNRIWFSRSWALIYPQDRKQFHMLLESSGLMHLKSAGDAFLER